MRAREGGCELAVDENHAASLASRVMEIFYLAGGVNGGDDDELVSWQQQGHVPIDGADDEPLVCNGGGRQERTKGGEKF